MLESTATQIWCLKYTSQTYFARITVGSAQTTEEQVTFSSPLQLQNKEDVIPTEITKSIRELQDKKENSSKHKTTPKDQKY